MRQKTGIEEKLKYVVKCIRLLEDIHAVKLLIEKPLSYSFPSGHTITTAVAGVLAKISSNFITLSSILT